MKWTGIYIVVLLFSATSCNSQKTAATGFFQGKVVYQVSIHPKQAGIDTATLRSLTGHTTIFYFKEGNYKQFYDSWGMKEELYLKAENRSYFKMEYSDTLYWSSMGKPHKKISSFEMNSKKDTILGIACDELVIHYPDETRRFYYNSNTLSIDTSWFGRYTFADKNFTSAKMKSLFLKCELDYPEFTVAITAVSIEPQQLNDTMFILPKNIILKERK